MKTSLAHFSRIEAKIMRSSITGETYSLSKEISRYFGARQVSVTQERISPGHRSSSPHRHSHLEELVIVCRGTINLHSGVEIHPLSEGSCVFFPPEDEALHHFSNGTEEEVELLVISGPRDRDQVITELTPLWTPPSLETDRTLLRAISAADAEAIFAYASNPKVSQLTLWEPHRSVKDSRDFVQLYCLPNYHLGIPEPWGITLKSNPDRVVGTIGCFWANRMSGTMELAYAIAEEHWGHGLVAEAAQAVLKTCFQLFDPVRIQARCKSENRASARVMEKIGMNHEGTLRSSVFSKNRYWDMVHYSILNPKKP
jgi:ribosomal-protein-alanine N-acetyltransferase